MIKMKNYWGAALLVLLMSACIKDSEDFVSSFRDYGNVLKMDDGITIDVDGFRMLKFNEESIALFADSLENGQRCVLTYELDETLAQNTYLVKVLAMADVELKDFVVLEESDTAKIEHTLVYDTPGVVVSGTNVNLQVQYLKDHEENELKLMYKPSMQEEGKDVKLVLVNVFEGEFLDKEDQTTGLDISTINIGQLASMHSPNREGDDKNIYFEIIYNPNSPYENTLTNLYIPSY
ncbi:hypothetical protein [Saccharicrinis aurantiacus]|uniref:hypothetical protein n=1 Tax=Saccharicrinis aurantiacus TaxID=1849719 RepID=UPI0024918AF1|nr:hypothetical protein [Saccharicrinis aurantiacus]